MRDRLGSIILGFLLATFVAATIAASYYSSTSHADAQVCKTQVYILSVVDDLAQTARVLVAKDKTLDPAVKQAFVNHYNHRHREIVRRVQRAGCTIPDSESQ